MPFRFALIALASVTAYGHDIITTAITFDREISRILYARCATCHHNGGSAFPLTTYAEARPWAVAIKEEILTRRMPPWGAVKGFGDFQDDQALTPEQIEVITAWVEGGVPEGEAKDLPKLPRFHGDSPAQLPQIGVANGVYTLKRSMTLGGLLPQSVPEKTPLRIVAALPDGSMEPLLWLENYKPQFAHPFLFRNPLPLPAGTVLKGIPSGAKIALLAPGGHSR
jgi:hypothetical protein